MRLTCYIDGCERRSRDVSWLDYIIGRVFSGSWAWYVCPEHRDLFSEEDEAEARRVGAIK
jgi:hypothetical protein